MLIFKDFLEKSFHLNVDKNSILIDGGGSMVLDQVMVKRDQGQFLVGLVAGFFLLLGSSLRAPLSQATTFANQPLKKAVQEAPIIALGVAGEARSSWVQEESRRTLMTLIEFSILDIYKGNQLIKPGQVYIRQPGGQVDDVSLEVPGTATFERDKEYVVFLGRGIPESRIYELINLAASQYNVQRNEKNEIFLKNSLLSEGEAVHENSPAFSSYLPLGVLKNVIAGQNPPENFEQVFPQNTIHVEQKSHQGHQQNSLNEKSLKVSSSEAPLPEEEPVVVPPQDDRSNKTLGYLLAAGIFSLILLAFWFFFLKGKPRGGPDGSL